MTRATYFYEIRIALQFSRDGGDSSHEDGDSCEEMHGGTNFSSNSATGLVFLFFLSFCFGKNESTAEYLYLEAG